MTTLQIILDSLLTNEDKEKLIIANSGYLLSEKENLQEIIAESLPVLRERYKDYFSDIADRLAAGYPPYDRIEGFFWSDNESIVKGFLARTKGGMYQSLNGNLYTNFIPIRHSQLSVKGIFGTFWNKYESNPISGYLVAIYPENDRPFESSDGKFYDFFNRN